MKSGENQYCKTAESPQRVIKHVSGFANQEPSSITSQHSGRPPCSVRVTKNEGSDNRPERVWGIAQVLAEFLVVPNFDIHRFLLSSKSLRANHPHWSSSSSSSSSSRHQFVTVYINAINVMNVTRCHQH